MRICQVFPVLAGFMRLQTEKYFSFCAEEKTKRLQISGEKTDTFPVACGGIIRDNDSYVMFQFGLG